MKVWAYVHPELNILCCAVLPEAIPQGVEYVELEAETPDDGILDNGQIRVKTESEKLSEEKQRKIDALKLYVATLLEQTDYIILKISEAQALGDMNAVEQLKQKYSAQLQRRESIRQWNDQMKQAIRNSQTLEELMSIEIRYG